MKKRSINLKLTITFLTIFAAMLALCFSSFAFAQTTASNQDPDPKPAPDVPKGSIQINAQRFDLGTIEYKLGESGTFEKMNDPSKMLSSSDLDGVNKVFLKVVPNTNKLINKEFCEVYNGTEWLQINDYDKLKEGKYELAYNPDTNVGQCANLGILDTRQITITLTEASKDMITNNFTLIAGHGDRNDVKLTSPTTSNDLYVDSGTTDKLRLSFAIRENMYFIPNITVNNQVYPTVDTGMHDEEEHLIICSTLEGSAASANTFQVDLSVFAEVTTDNKSDTIHELNASYEVLKEGTLINDGEFGLTANDTTKDPMVNDALVTFDFGLTIDNVEAHEVTDGMEVHLGLDVATFSDDNYTVVRNHEGQVEALDTTCKLIRDPGTGEVKGLDVAFTSDKFSEYSIVPANWQPVAPEESTTAQTGDATPIIPFVIAALFALGLVAISLKKNVLSNK